MTAAAAANQQQGVRRRHTQCHARHKVRELGFGHEHCHAHGGADGGSVHFCPSKMQKNDWYQHVSERFW